MAKGTTKEAAVAAEALLLDDWFDAIEDGVRARARGFIDAQFHSPSCRCVACHDAAGGHRRDGASKS
jgi:hypothetical protein